MIAGAVARARSLWRGIRRRGDVEAEMNEEFRLHLELRTEDLMRAGLSPTAARRRARLEFGSAEMHKDAARGARGLRPVDGIRVSWLDFKLGFRMLARYPGLTLVGGLAMAFAIWVGASTFELVTQVVRPTLPLHDGDRIVGLRNWDAAANRPDERASPDFLAWREELKTVQDLGAFRALERNLITGDGRSEPAEVAEISASAFRVTRVPPLLGRALVEADERPGAPAVAVIGHELWQQRFAGDSGVVGRTVRLGSTPTTIVGVMPEGYAFPVAHGFWAPLTRRALEHAPRQGPEIKVFGRLAPGVSLDEARAELATLGRRAAADHRGTHAHLRPQVLPYARSIVDVSGWSSLVVMSFNLPLVMLLVLVCANVALLMFARAATREGEIVVRNALGASRGRIVTQLFAEALVLGGLAAVVGLSVAGFGLRWVMGVIEGEFLKGRPLPFWFDDRLSPTTLLYAAALTVLGAVIAGAVPALKVTRGLGARLKQASAGGGGLRFGGLWTAVIVAQVAVTVAFPAVTFLVRRDGVQIRAIDVGFPSHEYLAVRLEMDREPAAGASGDTSRAAFLARFRTAYAELERRLAADPAVAGVTYGDRLPRMYHPHRLVEVDEGGAAPLDPRWPAYRVSDASVDPRLFDVAGVPIRPGRGFGAVDVDSAKRTVIVNASFVRLVMGGRNPIGRRLRYVRFEEWADTTARGPGPWYEIVGVVRDMGMAVDADVGQGAGGDPKVAGIYHAVPPDGAYPLNLAVHVRGDPAAFAPRLRALATATDPTLRLHDFRRLDEVNRSELEFIAFWFRLLLLVSAVALLLSLAGIYSVMSFTVSRRTREIGIRVALGANRWRVAAAILRRPLRQVALGIGAGAVLVTLLAGAYSGGLPRPGHAALVAAYATFMLGVCLLACVIPTRRALRIEPTEALREE